MSDLPFRSTGDETPARVTSLALVIASTASAPTVLVILGLDGERSFYVPVMISTTILSAIVAYFAPRARTIGRSVAWCLVGAALLGALNVGVGAAIMALSEGQSLGAAARLFLVGTFYGGVLGAPAGVVFGVAFLIPACATVRARALGSHAALERIFLIVGGWLTVVAIIDLGATGTSPHGAAAWAAALIGALALLLGLASTVHRARWLRRVETGRVKGWAIAPRDEWTDEDLRPFVHRHRDRLRRVLVRRVDVTSPYRESDGIAFALC